MGAVRARLYTGASTYLGILTAGGLFLSADANAPIPNPSVANALSPLVAVPDKNLERILSPDVEVAAVPPVDVLPKSTLDLDGKTPKDTYKNTAPENQSGRI